MLDNRKYDFIWSSTLAIPYYSYPINRVYIVTTISKYTLYEDTYNEINNTYCYLDCDKFPDISNFKV